MKSEATASLPTRALALFLGAVLVAVTLASVSPAYAQTEKVPVGAPLDVEGVLQGGGTFVGQVKNLHLYDCVDATDTCLASGKLIGTVTAPDGTTTDVSQRFADIPVGVSNESGVCDILFLDIGPIFLDLLGLTVDLSEIVLDINAVRGPGNLLGNLLCGLVGILD